MIYNSFVGCWRAVGTLNFTWLHSAESFYRMPKRSYEEDESNEEDEDLPELLAKAIKHCWGDEFLDTFREYFRKHAHKFEVKYAIMWSNFIQAK